MKSARIMAGWSSLLSRRCCPDRRSASRRHNRARPCQDNSSCTRIVTSGQFGGRGQPPAHHRSANQAAGTATYLPDPGPRFMAPRRGQHGTQSAIEQGTEMGTKEPARLQACAVVQSDAVTPFSFRFAHAHRQCANQGGSTNADERRAQHFRHLVDGGAMTQRPAAQVQRDIVPLRLEPIDFVGADKMHASLIANGKAIICGTTG